MTYAEDFKTWWNDIEPPGFDHPDTHEPIEEMFRKADQEIATLKARLSGTLEN